MDKLDEILTAYQDAIAHTRDLPAAIKAGSASAIDALVADIPHVAAASSAATLFGMRVLVDESLPPDVIEVRSAEGKVLARVVNIGEPA